MQTLRFAVINELFDFNQLNATQKYFWLPSPFLFFCSFCEWQNFQCFLNKYINTYTSRAVVVVSLYKGGS